MSLTSAERQEFASLLNALREAVATSEQSRRVNQLLIHHTEARELYFDHVALAVSLRWTLRGDEAAAGDSPTTPFDQASSLPSSKLPKSRLAWLVAPRSLAAAVTIGLSLYFVVMFSSIALQRTWWANRPQQANRETLVGAVARVTSVDGCQFADTSEKFHEGMALAEGSIQLVTGVMEVEFGRGATVALEGPTEFELRSANEGFLKVGKLVARVPQPAIGFTIDTPTVQVVDRGTEFGVDVDPRDGTNVEVITGKVDVHYKPRAQAEKPQRSVRMIAGAAKRFTGGAEDGDVTVTPIAPWIDKSAIRKSVAKGHHKSPAETKYAATVLADDPLAYWRLSEGSDVIAADTSGHGFHGQYRGFVSTSAPGLFTGTSDRGVHLIGPKGQGWLQLDEFPMPASFSIELWVRSNTPTWNTHGWFFSGRGSNGIIICPDKDATSWSFFLANDEGRFFSGGRHNAHKIDDRFHHYVCAYDAASDHAWMYFDGERVASTDNVGVKLFRPDPPPKKLSFFIGSDQSFGFERCGDGWVDEVAIYPRALAAESVRRHFEVANKIAKDLASQLSSEKAKESSTNSNRNVNK
jgi:hypothetical protein